MLITEPFNKALVSVLRQSLAFITAVYAECGRHGVYITRVSETASEAEIRAFLNEVNVMKSVGRHVNVIALVGCCTKLGQGQLTVVTSLVGC